MLQMMSIVLLWSSAVMAAAPDTGGDAWLMKAETAYQEATKLRGTGQYADAIQQAERALELWEAVGGGTHPRVAACLDLMGELHRKLGDQGRAEPLLQRGLSIREATLGKSHPDVASSLNNLAALYYNQGRYDRAEPLFERALAIREATLGKSHPDVASSLIGLAYVYDSQGLYGRAEPLYQRALAIREATLGSSHPDVASSLHGLAYVYTAQGLYGRAEPLYQRALAIREATLGKSHPDVASTLYGLALIYHRQGLYGRAELLYQRALAIQVATLGESHPDVASSLDGLAYVYHDQGLYGRAEPLYQRALAIREATLGSSHPTVAGSLVGLAYLYHNQGLYGRAEPLYQRALAIQEATLGKSHPDVATSLNNLALLYGYRGLEDRAEPLHQRALAIREETFGKSHPDVAGSLNNLANIYHAQGLYDRAESLYRRALTILEAAYGTSHPHAAITLNNLAELYFDQGLYDQAKSLAERALAIREAALGESHPLVATALNNLARIRLGQRRISEATHLLARALAISEGRLRHEALDFSESRLASFLQFLGRDEQRLYSLLRAHPDNADIRRLALTSALLFKGRSVEEAADTSRTILRSMSLEDRDAFERLRGLRTQLAKLSLDDPGQLAPAEYQQRLKRLELDGDTLEADLAKRSAPLRALTTLPSAADVLQRVVAAVPPNSVLVELVAYTYSPPVPKPGTPEAKAPTQPRYLAMLLFPDGRTSSVDLGPADIIDKAASQLRDALASRDARFQATAQQLYRLAFKPLQPLLSNTRKVFLAPDGQLALVTFAALHDGRRFLADTFDFTYLTSGRDIIPPSGDVPTSTSAVILADPDYSVSTPAQASVPAERSYSLERFYSRDRASLPQVWVPLPGSRHEAEAIQRLLPQAQAFLGADASKERLLGLTVPGILHMALHGFFLEDAAPSPGARGLGASLGGGPVPRLPDPLLRSGLVLAGASSPADIGNSLATALELAGLNLWGTQLVVLSACDTGRGDTSRGDTVWGSVKHGQGVYGLRRAFIVAGAETLVVSLWKVDDETTRTLMERYYRNLLAGQGRVSALREAMLSLRTQHPHPHHWAPFIAVGRDSPLRGFVSSAGQPRGHCP